MKAPLFLFYPDNDVFRSLPCFFSRVFQTITERHHNAQSELAVIGQAAVSYTHLPAADAPAADAEAKDKE